MSSISENPVLLIGGSGVVGQRAARALRKLQPELAIVIGGREVSKATSTPPGSKELLTRCRSSMWSTWPQKRGRGPSA